MPCASKLTDTVHAGQKSAKGYHVGIHASNDIVRSGNPKKSRLAWPDTEMGLVLEAK